MIPVTKPFLPPRSEYDAYLDGIWQRNWLTNSGPLVNSLELQLKEFLDLDHLVFLANGTIALQLAIKALGWQGEVITTPFSYVATASSIVWEGCRPVFVDIDRNSLNIDPAKIESAINKKTTGILATHVFGNPCEIEAIEKIANKYQLKVIYDAAHAFGVTYKNRSLYEFGDISTASFHATKLFHTIEGGAVITKEPDLLRKMSLMISFGHTSPTTFEGVGINGKNTELHAAMGICNLKYIEEIIKKRKKQCFYYDERLASLQIERQIINKNCEYNFCYYPVILESEELLLKCMENMGYYKIFPRRYFYPSLNNLDYVEKTECPVSEGIARRVLCLPLYHELLAEEQDLICRILLRTHKY